MGKGSWQILKPKPGRLGFKIQVACGMMGSQRCGGNAPQAWVKPTEAAGAAEEAHRRWPAGRSEQGREQGKG